MLKTAVVLASVSLLPALAHADADELTAPSTQPVQPIVVSAPPAPPAPQTDDWGNVSHINGQIVKVGERGDYLINNHQHINVAGNPFGPFFGYYDLAVTYNLSQNIAISGSLAGWSEGNGDHTGYQATISAPIYFRRTFSGPYLEPGLITRTSNYNDSYAASCASCSDYSSSKQWAGPELLLGWQWTFDSGLNLAAAIGPAKHLGDSQMSSNDTDVNGYFRVGYAF
jgi:hypothetical protein